MLGTARAILRIKLAFQIKHAEPDNRDQIGAVPGASLIYHLLQRGQFVLMSELKWNDCGRMFDAVLYG